jgi:hypothetical protein
MKSRTSHKLRVASKPTPAYVPNRVPLVERIFNICLAATLLAYGSYGFYADRLNISRRRSLLVALRDGPAWLLAAAMVCGALVLLSVVVDHYDRRNNEVAYKVFRWLAVRVGWSLLAAALISHLYLGFLT